MISSSHFSDCVGAILRRPCSHMTDGLSGFARQTANFAALFRTSIHFSGSGCMGSSGSWPCRASSPFVCIALVPSSNFSFTFPQSPICNCNGYSDPTADRARASIGRLNFPTLSSSECECMPLSKLAGIYALFPSSSFLPSPTPPQCHLRCCFLRFIDVPGGEREKKNPQIDHVICDLEEATRNRLKVAERVNCVLNSYVTPACPKKCWVRRK